MSEHVEMLFRIGLKTMCEIKVYLVDVLTSDYISAEQKENSL